MKLKATLGTVLTLGHSNELGHGGSRDWKRGWNVGLLCRREHGWAKNKQYLYYQCLAFLLRNIWTKSKAFFYFANFLWGLTGRRRVAEQGSRRWSGILHAKEGFLQVDIFLLIPTSFSFFGIMWPTITWHSKSLWMTLVSTVPNLSFVFLLPDVTTIMNVLK